MFDFAQIEQDIGHIAKDKEFFFIVGMPKSGSTWLQKMLDTHPDICCLGESHLGTQFAPNLKKTLNFHNQFIDSKNNMISGGKCCFPFFTEEHLLYLTRNAYYLLIKDIVRNSRFVGEKTPGHIRCLPLLADLFPGSRFIHIIRDGRDCTVSGWHHILREDPDGAKKNFPEFSAYAAAFAKEWTLFTNLGIDYGRQQPGRYLEIRYEDLHLNASHQMAKILEFIGADSPESVILNCVGAGSFSRVTQGRQPGEEDGLSHFRKGVTGDWKIHFDEAAIRNFKQFGQASLTYFGYDWD